MPKTRIIAVVGPTASGKTALSIELARRGNGEIVSCDSMQVYRGMDVGTAKPDEAERAGIPHHLIDVADASEPFSVAEYVALARRAVEEIAARGKTPVVCGGTGLYLDALLRGEMEETETDPVLRQALLDYAAEYGAHALHERLRRVDPESADAIHENNVKRVARALEIWESTGMTKTESDRRSRMQESPFDATVIGICYPDREVLYDRIARRVDEMLANGLVEETKRLDADGVFDRNATAAQAIGYKELLSYVRGEETLATARERLILSTRRYAKRQCTWFRAKEYVNWINATDERGDVRSLSALADAAEALGGK